MYTGKPIIAGVSHEGTFTPMLRGDNLGTYALATVLARGISGDPAYRVTHMYMEFVNGAVPELTASRSTTKAYYDGLSGRDYLRVPVVLHKIDTAGQNYSNNRAWLYGESVGAQGVLGDPFTQAAESKVFGGALVCCPDGNPNSDIVVTQFYFANQGSVPKLNNNSVSIRWPMVFK
jgi:hypothetical protein